MDAMPDSLIRAGKLSTRSIFVKAWLRLHLSALKKCHKIVVIGRDMKSWLKGIFPSGADKIFYIPLWQDDELIMPVGFKENPFIIGNKLSEYFVVQYSGNIGLWNEVGTLGKAVKQNIDNVEFIVIGGGIRKKELLDEFSVEDQKNIKIFPFQPNEIFNDIISASHVHLVTLKEELAGIAVPSKIYGILAAGRPVIAMVPEYSEIAYIVKEENCGFVINPADLTGLINAIQSLRSDENLTRKFGENSRKAFEKKYTTRIIAERYKTVLNQLII